MIADFIEIMNSIEVIHLQKGLLKGFIKIWMKKEILVICKRLCSLYKARRKCFF